MIEWIWHTVEQLLGLSGDGLLWWQLLLRALLIYVTGMTLVRAGKRRFMGTYTAFDVILGITVGALLSSAADDATVFLNAIVIVVVLVGLHWCSAFVTYKWDFMERLLTGKRYVIVDDGELNLQGMRKTRISTSTLRQALRKAGLEDLDLVKYAYLERNGEISIVPYSGSEESEAEDEDAPDRDDTTPQSGKRGGSESQNGQAAPEARPRIVEMEVEDGVQKVIVEFK